MNLLNLLSNNTSKFTFYSYFYLGDFIYYTYQIELQFKKLKEDKMKNVTIIGAGPAGISASLYLARSSGIAVNVITHGKSSLYKAEMIENYFGFAEPISGRRLLEAGRAGAERLGVNFLEDEVIDLQMTMSGGFEVVTKNGKTVCDALLIASGASRKKPPVSNIESYEGRGVSYCAVCDAFFYKGKPTAVIGSGAYAAHETTALTGLASSVTILTNGEELSAALPDGADCNSKKINSIRGENRVEAVVFDDGSELPVSGVFIAVGTAGSTELARKLGLLTENNRIIVNDELAAAIPGVFAAGDCIGGLMQVSKAVSDGAEAAMSIIKYLKEH